MSVHLMTDIFPCSESTVSLIVESMLSMFPAKPVVSSSSGSSSSTHVGSGTRANRVPSFYFLVYVTDERC